MLKTALFDYAINEKCCSVYGGRGICPLFSSPPRGIWQLKSPHPREFAIQVKKNANARGSARGGAGRSCNWLMHYSIMSAWTKNLVLCTKRKEQGSWIEKKASCELNSVMKWNFFVLHKVRVFMQASAVFPHPYLSEPQAAKWTSK